MNAINIQGTYNVTAQAAKLAEKIYTELNTEDGYKDYYELQKLITDNGEDDAILFDLAAAFDWDSRLNDACNQLAIAEGRLDLVYED